MPSWRVVCDLLRTPVFIEDCSMALSCLLHRLWEIETLYDPPGGRYSRWLDSL